MRASGLVEADVSHDAATEKCGDSQARAIEELVGDEEIERRQIIAQRAYRAYGNNSFRAEQLHREDVRAIVDFARREEMAASVAGEKRDTTIFEGPRDKSVRGIAEGSLHADFACAGKAGHAVEAAAADDADLDRFFRAATLFGLGHASIHLYGLDFYFAFTLSKICSGNVRIVHEEREPFSLHHLRNPFFLVLKRLQRVEVIAHDPGQRKMRGHGNQVIEQKRHLAAAVKPHAHHVRVVSGRANQLYSRRDHAIVTDQRSLPRCFEWHKI